VRATPEPTEASIRKGRQFAVCLRRGSEPVVVGGVTTTQGVRESRTQGKGVYIPTVPRTTATGSNMLHHGEICDQRRQGNGTPVNRVGWNAGCAETCLSGVGSAGRKPTAERQQGAVLRLHGDQFQRGPCPAGDHLHGCAVVSGVSPELSACRRTYGRARGVARPCDRPALGRAVQSSVRRGVSPA
jgi:hypothetical protein